MDISWLNVTLEWYSVTARHTITYFCSITVIGILTAYSYYARAIKPSQNVLVSNTHRTFYVVQYSISQILLWYISNCFHPRRKLGAKPLNCKLKIFLTRNEVILLQMGLKVIHFKFFPSQKKTYCLVQNPLNCMTLNFISSKQFIIILSGTVS